MGPIAEETGLFAVFLREGHSGDLLGGQAPTSWAASAPLSLCGWGRLASMVWDSAVPLYR